MPPKVKKAKVKKPRVAQKQKQTQIVTVNVTAPVKPKRKRRPAAKKAAAKQGSISPIETSQQQSTSRFIYPVQVLPKENPLITDELKAYLRLLHGGQQAPPTAPPMITAGQQPAAPPMITAPPKPAPAPKPAPKPTPKVLLPAPPPDFSFTNEIIGRPTPSISLADMSSLKQVAEVVGKSEKTPSLFGSTHDIDESRAAEEPESDQEKIVSATLEVEAQQAAEKARKKAGLGEDDPIPENTGLFIKLTPAQVKKRKEAEKELKAAERARKADENVARLSAKIGSGGGGFISRGFT